MNNPLDIPNILENIFSYLPTTCLVRLTYVNKMWRLEARRKLYQNRNEIIYNLLKWPLNDLRIYQPYHQELIPLINRSLFKVTNFRFEFDLNLNVELFNIRNQLQEQEKIMEAKYDELVRACGEVYNLFRTYPGNIYHYADFQKLDRETHSLDYDRFNAYKDLTNFENFLVKYKYIRDPEEVERISIACVGIRDWEDSISMIP